MCVCMHMFVRACVCMCVNVWFTFACNAIHYCKALQSFLRTGAAEVSITIIISEGGKQKWQQR